MSAKEVIKVSSNLIRKNVFVSQKVNEWLEKESSDTGLSQSSIISMALLNYIKQQETPEMINKLMIAMDELKEMEKSEKK